MPELQEENLKKIEPKEEGNTGSGSASSTGLFQPDRKKITAQIKTRREKLEKIRPQIPLKTYHSLLEKLSNEEMALKKKLSAKEFQIQQENREQALPKIFFEQKPLKPKAIRIE